MWQSELFFKHELIHDPLSKSAGTEGFDLVPPSAGCSMNGRYEIALLCLGMMHFRFGHPNLALEVSIDFSLSLPLLKNCSNI